MAGFLKKGKDSSDDEVNEPEVRITRGMYGKLIYRRLVQVLGFALLAAIVLYLCFAATWVRVVPTLSGAGFVPVKNVTYDGGILPSGAQVLVDTENKQGIKVVDRIKQSFVPSATAAKVQVLYGPYGKLQWAAPNILTVDGNPVGYPYPAVNDESPVDYDDPFLKNDYVGLCISGNCTPGEVIIFNRDYVYGSALIKEDLGD